MEFRNMHITPHTEESKQKIREKQMVWRKTQSYMDFVERQRARAKKSPTKFAKGHKSLTDGLNLLQYQKKENHWNWKGGITPDVVKVRGSGKMITWRKSIFKRDNYTCTQCGKRGVTLNADHHPIPFTVLYKSKNWKTMWDITNGRTLCIDCHNGTKVHWKEYYATA